MKKLGLMMIILLLLCTGCGETISTNENGNETREFTINQTATVNGNTIKINSVKKILKECSWEYDGQCQSYNEPTNDYFLLIDLTIENKGTKDLGVSSIMSFDLKNVSGEKGSYALLLTSIKSQLDGSIMPNDLLKGQIAYDVIDDEKFYFYYTDGLISNPVKFIIEKSDITE